MFLDYSRNNNGPEVRKAHGVSRAVKIKAQGLLMDLQIRGKAIMAGGIRHGSSDGEVSRGRG